MALRNVDNALKNALVDNVPLQVYHLIKFEKPSNIDYVKNNLTVPDTNFTYLTDAPYPVDFDGQTYNPTNFARVGAVTEDIVAKATGMTLSINANSIGRNAIAIVTIGQLALGGQGTLSTDIDLFQSGFLPGDEITLTNSSGSTFNFTVRIDSIKGFNSSTQKYETVVTALEQFAAVNSQIGVIEYSSSTTTALTANAQSVLNFQSYINKTVDIYRCFANPKTGDLYGSPVLLFKGIIAKAKLDEQGAGTSKMTWTLTSHWGDFVRVQGRLTSDEFHRALDATGTSNPDSLLKKEYEFDKGFEHAAKSLNVLAPYVNTRKRQKLRKKSSFFGLKKSYSMEEETYTVAEELDLNINLAAKFIPVVYGVNKIEPIPVFADIELGSSLIVEDGTQTVNATTLYTANVISEGPIRAIYDIIIDDEGLVCKDSSDQDIRAFGTTTDTYTGPACVGNMLEGDVLSGDTQFSSFTLSAPELGTTITLTRASAAAYLAEQVESGEISAADARDILESIEFQESAASASDYYSVGSIGITHEKRFNFNFGGDTDVVDITHHVGLADQNVNAKLYNVAQNLGFKIQSDYYKGSEKKDYWSASHQLLDTAYTVQVDTISASSGQQPQFDYIIKGKYVNCLNYDGSYKATVSDAATRQANYKLGDIVTVWIGNTSGTSTTAQIIDKFYLYDPYQQIDWRLRLGPNPNGNSNMDILTPVTNGSAGKVILRHSGGSSATDWVMIKESYTGDPSNPVQTDTTTSTGGSNLHDVQGLVVDGSGNFTYTSADFIFEKNYWDTDFLKDEDLYETGILDTTQTTQATYSYALVLDELYNNTFATAAVQALAATNKNIYFKFSIGSEPISLKVKASVVAASLNSTKQGKVYLASARNVSNTSYNNVLAKLDAAINNNTISTTKTVSTSTSLWDPTDSLFTGGTTTEVVTYTNLPTISAKSYSLIYQDSSDGLVPSSEANGLNITFARDAGGEFTANNKVVIPVDNTAVSTWCDTNNVLALDKNIIDPISGDESILTGLTYSYGTVDDEILLPSEGGTGEEGVIFNGQDSRVTNNPALILLDYLTNKRFGKGLTKDLIDVESFREAAIACDTRSDVTVTIVAQDSIVSGFQVGDICRYPTSGDLVFQGTISSIEEDVTQLISNGNIYNIHQITFTDCIGKLGKKWTKTRYFAENEIVWYNGRYRIVSLPQGNTTGVTSVPESSPGSGVPFTSNETNPPSVTFSNLRSGGTFNVDPLAVKDWKRDPSIITPSTASDFERSAFYAANGNPLVKRIEENNGKYRFVSGYSLYDSDDVKYWKYLGWESWDQRWATRHQMNIVIDTSQKLFDNVNSLLQQFNGILRYSNGKYFLDLKVKAKPLNLFDPDTEIITENDIIGAIALEDKGISNTFNALSCQMSDPALTFNNRTLSFFNSNYLSQDKGIQRQGTYTAPGITNYFNLRINAQQALDESRAGLTISFTMPPKGYLLLAGNLIAITYEKFNWENKLFRIENIKTNSDLLVNVVAREHNDSAYLVNYMANDLVTVYSDGPVNPNTLITRPINLTATSIVEDDGAVGGIGLEWENTGTYSESTHAIEIWMNPNGGNFQGASHILTAEGTTITDPILQETGTVERWYWIRYKILPGLNSNSNNLDPIFSKYYPDKTETGIKGIGTASMPERIHGIPKGATTNTPGKISTDPNEEIFSLSSSWTVDPEFGGTIPSGAYAVQRLTEPLGAKRYQFVWNGERLGEYKWRGPNDTHTLSDIKLTLGGEEYTIGSLQSSYSTTTTVTNGTRNWDYYAMKTTRTDGLAAGQERFIFDSYPPLLASRGAPGNGAQVPEVDAIVSLANVVDNDTRELYIIFDHNVPECFLAQWDDVTNSGNGPSYWRDIGDGSATLDTAWTEISGTSFTNDEGYTITGVGTTFTTDLQAGDVIALTAVEITSSSTVVPQHSARVAEVISDTVIKLDRANTAAAYTINYLYRTAYRPDTTNDAVIAQIDRGS